MTYYSYAGHAYPLFHYQDNDTDNDPFVNDSQDTNKHDYHHRHHIYSNHPATLNNAGIALIPEPPSIQRRGRKPVPLSSTTMTMGSSGGGGGDVHPLTPSSSSPPSRSSKGSEPRSFRFSSSRGSASATSGGTTKWISNTNSNSNINLARRRGSSSSSPFVFNAHELDLPLDDDLWLPAAQASEMSLTAMEAGVGGGVSRTTVVERGMLFPWMADTEIV